MARREDLDDHLIRSFPLPELVYLATTKAAASRHALVRDGSLALNRAAFRLYGRAAARRLRRFPGLSVYHYRSGFGQESVGVARSKGAITLCDQSLAHPFVLPSLLETGTVQSRPAEVDPIGQLIADDIGRAEHVVVNSDFVRGTMIAAGWPAERIHVLYWGVDDSMMRRIQQVPRPSPSDELRLVFAGRAERRKGFQTLASALPAIQAPWRLTIAGPVSQECRPAMARLAADPRVSVAGVLTRDELATLLVGSDALVFPTLAEGSARVVFEALAAECYVITTPNAGSILVDGVGGRLVSPFDASAVAVAVDELWENRVTLNEVVSQHATLIAQRYSQRTYGQGLRSLYQRLTGSA